MWGKISDNFEDYLEANRDLEKKVRQLGGRKVLYAHHYYPEDTFWEIYDQSDYQKLREKYHAEVFPDIYEKTVVTEDYNPSILAGFSHVFDKLLFG
ncbi:MAG: hypothetical protein BRC25_03650 [Parcubacteria group bacterium SW_6_46_9]|nr:MAG: hypothetical protein BRC25_03650 [Parcubacteria group bacterium SW_6_46_9]